MQIGPIKRCKLRPAKALGNLRQLHQQSGRGNSARMHLDGICTPAAFIRLDASRHRGRYARREPSALKTLWAITTSSSVRNTGPRWDRNQNAPCGRVESARHEETCSEDRTRGQDVRSRKAVR